MEKIFLNPANLAYWQGKAKSSVIALGFFDGVHKGHQEVIQTAAEIAKGKSLSLTVMSFFPHPKTVLSNGKKHVDYLMPLSDKEKILRKLGVDTFYIVEFDREFSALSPEEFVIKYLIDLGVVHAVAGFDYSYGFRGAGHLDRLQSDSGGLIQVTKVNKVECRGEKISSTCIREKLLKGNVEEIPDFLGRPYEVECEWDGYSLKISPYYTLPGPGRYVVTIKGDIKSQDVEVLVSDKKELISENYFSELVRHNKELLTIIWHNRVSEEMNYPIYENTWIQSSLIGSVLSG